MTNDRYPPETLTTHRCRNGKGRWEARHKLTPGASVVAYGRTRRSALRHLRKMLGHLRKLLAGVTP